MHLETDTGDDVKGPLILFSEFEAAFTELKWKVRRTDGIPAELLKAQAKKAKRS